MIAIFEGGYHFLILQQPLPCRHSDRRRAGINPKLLIDTLKMRLDRTLDGSITHMD
jgi:hypothetical protein